MSLLLAADTIDGSQKPLDVLEPEIIYEPSWDNAFALLVQKTFYGDDLRWLTKYRVPDDVRS
jgi:hypothetical protein